MKIILALLCATVLLPGAADDPDLGRLFRERGLQGVMIISSLDGSTEYVHKGEDAGERRPPASTFKIPNTLIALDCGAIRDENEVIHWDGTVYRNAAWNRDQTLATALEVSCVWAYQVLARRVGEKRYREYLKKLNYGNAVPGPRVDSFWLDGDLRISPREQVDFLKRLVRRELPFRDDHVDLLRRILVRERTRRYTLRAKTGSSARVVRQYGWWVGWVRTDAQVWVFATCIEIHDAARDLPQREALTRAALKLKGII